jgi:hypothetical protein
MVTGNEGGVPNMHVRKKKLLDTEEQGEGMVMKGSMPCRLASEIHVDG